MSLQGSDDGSYHPNRTFSTLEDMIKFYNRGHPLGTELWPDSTVGDGSETFCVHLPDSHGDLKFYAYVHRSILKTIPTLMNVFNIKGRDMTPKHLGEKGLDDCINIFNDGMLKISRGMESRGMEIPGEMNFIPRQYGKCHKGIKIPFCLHVHLGLVTETAHLILFQAGTTLESLEVWVRRRSVNAKFWPGKLDTAISTIVTDLDDKPHDAVRRAAAPYAVDAESLEKFKRIKFQGTADHYSIRDFQDSKLPSGPAPTVTHVYSVRAFDGWSREIRPYDEYTFEKYKLGPLLQALRANEFKPDSAIALTRFLSKFEGAEIACGKLDLDDKWNHRLFNLHKDVDPEPEGRVF